MNGPFSLDGLTGVAIITRRSRAGGNLDRLEKFAQPAIQSSK